MKAIHWLLGIFCSFALMIVLLITSIEAVVYWTPGYFEKEYKKYQVTEAVQMEMEDLLDVTHEMMAYLRGEREDLHVPTVVAGMSRDFFSEREIAHMEDVQGLFLAALVIRRVCIGVIASSMLLLVLLKARLSQMLPRFLCVGTVTFFVVLAALAGIIATDFTKYFIIFHQIFFNNDLWLLDPRTDLLINIVPEPFFVDTAARIGMTFGAAVVAVFAVCFVLQWRQKRNVTQL